MARRFADITFTPSVLDAQRRYGSFAANQRFLEIDEGGDPIGPTEAAFIELRDGFYQATVNEKGWPYVQFRGGPRGFLKVLDGRTIGYADFRGNLQYLSVGNLNGNDRVAMILMDYPNRRRLKVWARARLVHRDEDPDLVARLEIPTYRARVERAVVMTVEAADWNCPQHITPRFSADEIAVLAAQEQAQPTRRKSQAVIGDGPLDLLITGVRQLTPEVRAYELRRPDFTDLPPVTAGSQLQVPVRLPDGATGTRTFSISSNPGRHDAYEIAVQLRPDGGGGTRFIHENYGLGLRLKAGLPRNAFRLHDGPRPTVLIAGGIGITPLKAMGQALLAAGRDFTLYYAGRSRQMMAYRSKLELAFTGHIHLFPGDEEKRLDIEAILSRAADDTLFYVCGPNRLLEAVRATADRLGIDPCRVRFERFSSAPEPDDEPFPVRLARSGLQFTVDGDQSLLDAVLDAGVEAPYSCKAGTCGACAVKVLEGTPHHRDTVLSNAERDQAGLMCACVSRSLDGPLVLDL